VIGVVLALAAVVPYALWLREAEREALAEHSGESAAESTRATHHLLGLIVVDVALIVGGSFGMVEAALSLGHRWGISEALLGVTRVDGSHVGVPGGWTVLGAGDTAVIYGRDEALDELDRRPAGPAGDRRHEAAMEHQRLLELAERTADLSRDGRDAAQPTG